MSQIPKSKPGRSADAWAQLMAEYEASNMTQREFCAQRALAYSTFGYWRKRLRQSVPAKAQAEPLFELPVLPMNRDPAWRVELDLGEGVVLRLK